MIFLILFSVSFLSFWDVNLNQFPFMNRLVAKTTQLESENSQKEAEVNKLMEENVRLTALLDKKEAQLLAMNEQFKVMALSSSRF